MVMYLGKIVEVAPSEDLYTSQEHPYTRALLSSIPVPDPRIESKRRLVELSGEIPSPLNPALGLPVPHTLYRSRRFQDLRRCRTAARAEGRRPPRRLPFLRSGPDEDRRHQLTPVLDRPS